MTQQPFQQTLIISLSINKQGQAGVWWQEFQDTRAVYLLRIKVIIEINQLFPVSTGHLREYAHLKVHTALERKQDRN